MTLYRYNNEIYINKEDASLPFVKIIPGIFWRNRQLVRMNDCLNTAYVVPKGNTAIDYVLLYPSSIVMIQSIIIHYFPDVNFTEVVMREENGKVKLYIPNLKIYEVKEEED
jgi:hypothetical protein